MAKQTTTTTETKRSAVAAFEALQAKHRENEARDSELVTEQVALERAGVVPETPEEQRRRSDLDDRARRRLNGAAFSPPVPQRENTRARLFDIVDEREEIRLSTVLVRQQLSAAAGAASQEAYAANSTTFLALHRHRALLVVQLLKANREIEQLRRKCSFGGISTETQVDGFTSKLFGDPTVSNPFSEWPKKYLAACIRFGAISKGESEC